MRPPRLAAVFVVFAVAASGCGGDRAALIDDDAAIIEAGVGDLRVIDYAEDPAAGDDWRPVVAPAASVLVEKDPFREADSRFAAADEPGRVRRLFEGAADGRTLVVEVNCGPCADGGTAAVDDADVHVWAFTVGDGGDLLLGPGTLEPGPATTQAVGDVVAVVRTSGEEPTYGPDGERQPLPDQSLMRLRRVERHGVTVDLWLATRRGATLLRYGDDRYTVSVS